MKVLCVDKDAWPPIPIEDNEGIIENGNTYEVVNVFFDDGYIFYVLKEDETDGYGYWENCFARTSDKDEKEFERNYNLQQKEITL